MAITTPGWPKDVPLGRFGAGTRSANRHRQSPSKLTYPHDERAAYLLGDGLELQVPVVHPPLTCPRPNKRGRGLERPSLDTGLRAFHLFVSTFEFAAPTYRYGHWAFRRF